MGPAGLSAATAAVGAPFIESRVASAMRRVILRTVSAAGQMVGGETLLLVSCGKNVARVDLHITPLSPARSNITLFRENLR